MWNSAAAAAAAANGPDPYEDDDDLDDLAVKTLDVLVVVLGLILACWKSLESSLEPVLAFSEVGVGR